MAEYPIRLPRGEQDHHVASVESFINERFESVSAERMSFSDRVIANALELPFETVRDMLAPLKGGEEELIVWRNARRRRRPPP